ncbi:hypothetical protein RQM59_12930 [Flavobacteriaceae bacterium S356]|uniref:DUF4468 domain-containing protein n=1 Tax=Asprobacillus argus TaxID=3076534 RepID=A0ABU3LBG6_9FLAO|nr:hypothetical protein [Flavobacteriaceae bacterium S356]MDT7833291.1 hypothetical protein [Flavobacteriaceae bacterium S356]
MKLTKITILIIVISSISSISAQETSNKMNWEETIEFINKNKSEFKTAIFTSPDDFIFQLDKTDLKITYITDGVYAITKCAITKLDKVNNEGAQIFLDFNTEKCTRYEYKGTYKKGVEREPANKLEVDFIDFFLEKEDNSRSRKIIEAFKHLASLASKK